MTGLSATVPRPAACLGAFGHALTVRPCTGRDCCTGKRDITQAVFGLQMPKQDQISMQIGRLVFWSNDLLNELLGEGFESRQHASAFLWWPKAKS